MHHPLIDVRDDEALSAALSQVFLFVEEVNAKASREVHGMLEQKLLIRRKNPGKTKDQEFYDFQHSIAHVQLNLKNIILQMFHLMVKDQVGWSKDSALLSFASRIGLEPAIDPRVLEALVNLLLRPTRIVLTQGGTKWRLEPLHGPTTSLPQPAGMDVLFERLWLYSSDRGPLLASRPVLQRAHLFVSESPVYYWEEPYDPVGIVRLFLAESLGEAGRSADHYLQRWLRRTFQLSVYDKRHKYALAEICELFNRIFYDSVVPTMQAIHRHRTATVSISLLVNELASVLYRSDRRAGKGEEEAQEAEGIYLRQALGLYLFLHSCRQLRRRTFWPDLEKIRESEKASNKGSEGDYESEEKLDKLAGLSGDQSVSALRPLGYTYFQTRVFGVISSVPGLSNVFRGGLLPRTDSGRAIALLGPAGIGKTVFALQILADIARFGGLSVYLSFEESYDSIVDRLVTFGLWDHFKFQVKRAGDDLTQVIQKAQAQEEEHGKGLLIFYEPGDAAGTTLPDIIDTIGQSVANWEGFKALAIDSVNSLPLPFGSFPEGIDESIVRIEPWKLYGPPSERLSEESRSYLYDSIVRIEHWKLYGILLGEKDGRYYRVLPYLADTVIELGSDENARTRWLEIKKCRVQDYHEGRHPFRLLDSRGAIIYPSLASRRSSLRGRVRSTLSQHRVILYPSPPERGRPKNLTPDLVIPEKSATLIWGPQGSGKTLVALKLLTGASTLRKKEGTGSSWSGNRFDLWTPQNVMVITFRASEKNFEQSLRNQKDLASKWKRIQQNWVRWYSPGSNLTAEQIVAEIWRYFKDSRRKGVPVDRILFDETEVAADVLPALQRDSLFWPTILELTSTEAATSFFVCESVNEEQSAMRVLRASMDNILYVRREESDGKPYRRIEVVQHSERVPLRSQIDEPLDLQAQAATPQNPEKKAAVPKQVEVPPAE